MCCRRRVVVREHDVVHSHSEPSAILDLLCACLDNEGGAFGDFYRCAISDWNRYSIFDNMHVFRFRPLGSKMPIHASKKWRCGDLTSVMEKRVNETSKGHIFGREDKIGPSVGPVRVTKRAKDKERNLTVAIYVFAETTHVVRWKINFAR